MPKREPQTPGDVPQHEPASQADSTQAEDLGEPSMPMSEVRRLIAQETAKAVEAAQSQFQRMLAEASAAKFGADGAPNFRAMHSTEAKAWFDAHPDAPRVPVLCADGWYVQPDAYAAPDQAKR